MRRATEKGLMISFIGFFAQIFFQFISLSYMQYLCCLQFTDLLILVGILFIYMGRFEFSQKHQDMAKYSIILFIVVQIGLFALPFLESSPEITAASNGLRIALVFLINLMLIYHITSEKGRNILKGALVLGIIGAIIFAVLIIPILQDDASVDEEMKDLLGKDETVEVLLAPSIAKEDFKENITELNDNNILSYENISSNYEKWRLSIAELKVEGDKYYVDTSQYYSYLYFDGGNATPEDVANLNGTINDILGELNGLIKQPDDEITIMYNKTQYLQNNITINLHRINKNNENIDKKSTAIILIDKRLDNIMEQNKYKLIIVLPTLLFGIIYFRTHKAVKEELNRQEAEMKKKLLSEVSEEEEEDEEEEDDDEVEEERVQEISKEKEIKRKKTPPKGKKKGAKIMDLDEIRKKYNK